MPLSNNTLGSAGSIGQVLGSATALVAGTEVLPRTGTGSWVFFLVLLAMIAAGTVLFSFIVTRVIRRFF